MDLDNRIVRTALRQALRRRVVEVDAVITQAVRKCHGVLVNRTRQPVVRRIGRGSLRKQPVHHRGSICQVVAPVNEFIPLVIGRALGILHVQHRADFRILVDAGQNVLAHLLIGIRIMALVQVRGLNVLQKIQVEGVGNRLTICCGDCLSGF